MMLICPQCTFPNSDHNKFCQNCGTSLTDKIRFDANDDIVSDTNRFYDGNIPLRDIQSEQMQILTQSETTYSLLSMSEISTDTVEVSSGENPDSSMTILQLDLDHETEDRIVSDQMTNILLYPSLISWEYAAYTDTGRQRNHNEDYFAIDSKVHKQELPEGAILTKTGLYILCDGMGGHAGGEVASKLAVNTIRKYFQETWTSRELLNQESIKEAVYLANQAIYDLNQQQARSGMGRMGTTLVMLLLQDHQAAIAHVGDSRLYCLTHREGLVQLTIDHEVAQREISRGVEPIIAYGRADAYQLTQALGPRDQDYLHPDVSVFDIHENMLLLLVSDGLSDNECLETHWQTHLQPLLSYDSDLEMGIQDLIELGNEYNGHDNITAILVRVKVSPSQPGLSSI
ncbi:serine/threonine phosphatase [Dolichospermum circinale]|uniref:serine/threonine phosphatase n=1 Tax=Dolichospermum circinale TaxID=109265 RepID=UPI003A91817D